MNWTLAAFAILTVALVGGFTWYERSHPSAKILALVATLAALAALGRIAFAPLPSVKPTSDIVLISGYALGAAPGFAVGAVAALTSNIFFGQGPWTPWQMAAWGAVGIFGAVLAKLTGRRVPRVPMAAACGLAGLGFGTIMNVFTWLTFSDPDSGGGGLIAIAGRALPFDIAHAVGNVAFFLAFGPALIAAIARFRVRFEVKWTPIESATRAARSAGAAPPLVAVLAALLLAGAWSAPQTARAASTEHYLAGAQNSDGGWGGDRGQASTSLFSGWAALGAASAGLNPSDVRRGSGKSSIDYIRKEIGGITDVGELERTTLVLGAAGLNARKFAGHDLVAAILKSRRAGGSIGGQSTYTAFGIMALRAGGLKRSSPSIRRAAAWLAGQQNHDGGFNTFGKGGGSAVDDTGAALQGLAAAGRRGHTAVRGVAFLRREQAASGGFPLSAGGTVNAQSTAYAALGLIAAGVNPDGVHRHGGRSPLAYLRSLTAADGSVQYSRTSRQTPVWVTAQAMLALNRTPLPLAAVPASAHSSSTTGGVTAPAATGGLPNTSGGASGASAGAAGGSATGGGASASQAKPGVLGEPAGPEPTELARSLAFARVAGVAAGLVFTPLSGPKR
jgi:energy-coupling factor transport system substrate-specific component